MAWVPAEATYCGLGGPALPPPWVTGESLAETIIAAQGRRGKGSEGAQGDVPRGQLADPDDNASEMKAVLTRLDDLLKLG